MPYTPQAGDEGMNILLPALRDFITADPAIIALLPNGASSVIPEGFMTHELPTPVIMPAMLGDGESQAGIDDQLVRLIVYVLDRGRGYYEVEQLLHRLRARLNDKDAMEAHFTFPPTEPLRVWGIKARGTTASASFPAWKCEGRGLYVFINVGGLPTAV